MLVICAPLAWFDSLSQPPHQQCQATECPEYNQQSPNIGRELETALASFLAWLWSVDANAWIAVFTIILAGGTVRLVLDGREHSRRSLRAYLSIEEIAVTVEPPQVVPSAGRMVIGLTFRNVGQTPAYNLRVECDGRFLRRKDQVPAIPPIKTRQGGIIVGPTQPHVLTRYIKFSKDEYASLGRGDLRPTLTLRIEYEDAFREFRFYEFHGLITPDGHSEWRAQTTTYNNAN